MLLKMLNIRMLNYPCSINRYFHSTSYFYQEKQISFPLYKFYEDFNSMENIDSIFIPDNKKSLIKLASFNEIKDLSSKNLNVLLQHLISKNEIVLLEKTVEASNFGQVQIAVLTFILYSYIDTGEIKKAIALFQKIKEQGLMKHPRLYGKLIIALCQAKEINLAFNLFKEFSSIEFSIKTSRLKKPNNILLVSLIQAAQLLETTPELQKETNFKGIDIINSVLEYLCKWNLPLQQDYMEYLYSWFHNQQKNPKKTFLTSNQRCGNCSLELGVEEYDWTNFVDNYTEMMQRDLTKKGMGKDVSYLNKFFRNASTFDVVIDGGNLLYKGSRDKKIFTPNRIKQTLNDLCKNENKFFKIALVLPQSYSRTSKMKNVSFLHDIAKQRIYDMNLNIIVCKSIHDDVVFLYLAAMSERVNKNIKMISNDNFFDHLCDLDEDLQSDFLKWKNKSIVKVNMDGNVLMRPTLGPLYETEDKIHLIGENQQILCINKNVDK